MGIKQSKTTSNNKLKAKATVKVEKRKKFRSLRSNSNIQVITIDESINEAWRFTGSGKRIHYAKNSKYNNAVDKEVERLQKQHCFFKRIWQSNYSAPVEEKLRAGAKVLDIGCGPGTWTIEMAETYEQSTFTGVDYVPLFSQEMELANVKFLQANILDGLPFLEDSFDFIRMGLLVTAFNATELKEKVIPEIVRITKPGGWIEFMESDIQYYNEGSTTARLTNALSSFMKSKGILESLNSYIPQSLEGNEKIQKGIQTEEKTCFVGKWAGDLGKMAVEDIANGWTAIKAPLSKAMKMKSQEYDELVATFAKEVEQNKTSFKTWRFVAQKIGSTTSISDIITTTTTS
ncbi:S-adenosyl-L-methionine-dependent methyltransferase [Gigaspora margarita]|uniref:S-adenosyl-L-methionine-dependent methyltransferase n=3 Tax=Gigaspora margarita TaxID=4874 RepID=A0A8H3XCP2_GIGMA|nr:S-adenosyl-L-methionine-dependent methyltransferase [Gigaspora margarita]